MGVVHLVDVQAIPPPGGLDPTDAPQRQVGDMPRRLVEMRPATRLRLRLRLDLLLRPGTDVDVVVIAVIGVLDHPHNVHPLRLEIPASSRVLVSALRGPSTAAPRRDGARRGR